jgi:hypothetical protein
MRQQDDEEELPEPYNVEISRDPSQWPRWETSRCGMELSGNAGLRNRLCGGNIPYGQADHPGVVADLEMVEEAECRWKKKGGEPCGV